MITSTKQNTTLINNDTEKNDNIKYMFKYTYYRWFKKPCPLPHFMTVQKCKIYIF